MFHFSGVENAAFQKQESSPQKPEPTESEVYFADVSSCCNISVRNDGQDSSLYDEALERETHKPRLTSLQKPDNAEMSNNQLLQNFTETISSSTATEDEDYLAHRMNNRQMSTRSRMPFPLPSSDELQEFTTDPCVNLIPKDISQNSLCSSVQTPMTETTDDAMSPVDCTVNYFPDSTKDLTPKHRPFMNEHFLAPDAQYEVIPEQDNFRSNSSNLTNTISTVNNYGKNFYGQAKPSFGYNQASVKNTPPKTLNLNHGSPAKRNLGSNISTLIQNLGGNAVGLLYGEANSGGDEEEVQVQGCHSDETMDSGWQSGSEKLEVKKADNTEQSTSKPVNV